MTAAQGTDLMGLKDKANPTRNRRKILRSSYDSKIRNKLTNILTTPIKKPNQRIITSNC